MDITPYVDSLRRDLVAAAEAGGPDIKAAAERLTLALDPAARLALMEALSQAAAEITSELPSGSVDVRLNGRELDFVVSTPLAEPAAEKVAGPRAEDEEDAALARITLRIPESVKARAEEFAGRQGQSLNTWLVGIVRMATSTSKVDIDLSSRRMTGWI